MTLQTTGNWVQDIANMHIKFGVNPVIRNLSADKLDTFLEFRIKFLQEELDEMVKAQELLRQAKNDEAITDGTRALAIEAADDIVDACIDLCVVAIGTLNAFDVDPYVAWNRVHGKNMEKEPGVNPNRPNPLGLPDLIKPTGWTPPTHSDNTGILTHIAHVAV